MKCQCLTVHEFILRSSSSAIKFISINRTAIAAVATSVPILTSDFVRHGCQTPSRTLQRISYSQSSSSSPSWYNEYIKPVVDIKCFMFSCRRWSRTCLELGCSDLLVAPTVLLLVLTYSQDGAVLLL